MKCPDPWPKATLSPAQFLDVARSLNFELVHMDFYQLHMLSILINFALHLKTVRLHESGGAL